MLPPRLSEHFDALDRLLWQHRTLWQFRPFANATPPWADTPLWFWLQTLSTEACTTLEADHPARVAALNAFIPDAATLDQLSQLPSPVAAPDEPLPARLSYHIPGRKWAQIRAFDQAITPSGNGFVEWCAGKGHLGRLLAFRHQRPVTSLEWQPALCADGQRLADQLKLPCRLQQQDVLAADCQLPSEHHAVALHACGKLHLRLMEVATQAKLPAISLSPCCYHLIDEEEYPARSHQAQASPLRLSRADLKLSLQDTVTAGQRERRLRDRELSWRLGFDLLQREVRGCDDYLPCPTVPKSRLSGDFPGFCHWMAECKGLILPTHTDYAHYESAGAERVLQVARMELVRNLFRRPLELWLALDRALYLEEQGYEVQLSQFCDYRLTPRNLLIQAVRPDAPAPP